MRCRASGDASGAMPRVWKCFRKLSVMLPHRFRKASELVHIASTRHPPHLHQRLTQVRPFHILSVGGFPKPSTSLSSTSRCMRSLRLLGGVLHRCVAWGKIALHLGLTLGFFSRRHVRMQSIRVVVNLKNLCYYYGWLWMPAQTQACSYSLSRPPCRERNLATRLGKSPHKPSTSRSLFTPSQHVFNRAEKASRVSSQALRGTVSARRFRNQATAVSCNISS